MQMIGFIAVFVAFVQYRHNLVWVPATVIFILHSSLPLISTTNATLDVVRVWIYGGWNFRGLLGMYNMLAHYARWHGEGGRSLVAEEIRNAAPIPIWMRLCFPPSTLVGAPRWTLVVGCFLWLLVLLTFVVDELLGQWCGIKSLVFMKHDDDLSNVYHTLSFLAGICSAWAQQEFMHLMRKREILLWLLGARMAVAGSVGLLMAGIVAVRFRFVKFLNFKLFLIFLINLACESARRISGTSRKLRLSCTSTASYGAISWRLPSTSFPRVLMPGVTRFDDAMKLAAKCPRTGIELFEIPIWSLF